MHSDKRSEQKDMDFHRNAIRESDAASRKHHWVAQQQNAPKRSVEGNNSETESFLFTESYHPTLFCSSLPTWFLGAIRQKGKELNPGISQTQDLDFGFRTGRLFLWATTFMFNNVNLFWPTTCMFNDVGFRVQFENGLCVWGVTQPELILTCILTLGSVSLSARNGARSYSKLCCREYFTMSYWTDSLEIVHASWENRHLQVSVRIVMDRMMVCQNNTILHSLGLHINDTQTSHIDCQSDWLYWLLHQDSRYI